MSVVFGVLSLFVVGGVVWGIVAAARRQGGEPFPFETAVGAYACLLCIVGTAVMLTGVATAVKAGLGYARLGYSYRSYTFQQARTFDNDQQRLRYNRASDLLQGLTLGFIGALVAGAHAAIAFGTRRLRGGTAT